MHHGMCWYGCRCVVSGSGSALSLLRWTCLTLGFVADSTDLAMRYTYLIISEISCFRPKERCRGVHRWRDSFGSITYAPKICLYRNKHCQDHPRKCATIFQDLIRGVVVFAAQFPSSMALFSIDFVSVIVFAVTVLVSDIISPPIPITTLVLDVV